MFQQLTPMKWSSPVQKRCRLLQSQLWGKYGITPSGVCTYSPDLEFMTD